MKIKKATYIRDYVIELIFSDGVKKTIDLEAFLMSETNPMTTKFRNKTLFKKFTIEYGNLSWLGELDILASDLRNWKQTKTKPNETT